MNIFVASWFFPPATSSEGIVTYKLLRNSKYHYDVFSSTSRQWGYQKPMQRVEDQNLTCYSIETDNIEEWVEASVAKFEELYPKRLYKCIMTRSMPPESILVGMRIKEKHPEVKWIASMGDPIANNPYEIKAYIDDCITLHDKQKIVLKQTLQGTNETALIKWEKRPEVGIRLLCKLKRWENTVLQKADLVITPSEQQILYTLCGQTWNIKYFALPHSFDSSFYSRAAVKKTEKIIFSFIGYSDAFRSLEPFVKAVQHLKEKGSSVLSKLEMRFIGNNPRSIYDMVLNAYLEDIIKFRHGVDYYKSLELMQESDWLLHVDAFFPQLASGRSIFFAGKLADYMGAGKPVFALTGKGSVADQIVTEMGGISVQPWEILSIADKLEDILSGNVGYCLNTSFIARYSAPAVAATFDSRVEELCDRTWTWRNLDWPDISASNSEKIVTICVPAYNVERYLERCLWTLINHEMAAHIEILVIDDGSTDHTSEVARALADRYPQIIRFIQKENGGHGSTINRAIAEGAGKYFMVVDGDDWIDGSQFAKLLAKLKTGEIDTDIVSSNYHVICMGTGISEPRQQQARVEYFKATAFEDLDFENVYFTLASTLIKLSILRQIGKPLQEKTFYVDVEYILFPVPYLKNVTFVDYFIYKYCRGNTEQSVYIPTMVKRYDHHERVMKSVLAYKQEHQMSKVQRTYYDAILKRHLYTHYALFMVYDTDKKQGYEMGKRFDLFLRQTDPVLAKWVSKNIPMVRIARRYDFKYDLVEHSPGAKMLSMKSRIVSKIRPSLWVRRLVYNRVTVRIGKMKFFAEGRGKGVKDRLRRFCGFS